MRKLFVFFIVSMVHVSLHGMLSADNKDILWNIIIVRNVSADDYRAHRDYVLVDKRFYKIIENEYRPTKKLIEKLMWRGCSLIIPQNISWNKDFSKCAWVITVEKNSFPENPKKMELTLVKMDDTNKDIIVKTGLCGGYKFPAIIDKVSPVFDKKGGIVYHGVGNNRGEHLATGSCLVEYSLNFDREMQVKRCVIGVGTSRIIYPHALTKYPLLLEAILQSTHVYDIAGLSLGIEKAYHIDGMIIPEDYMAVDTTALKQCPWDWDDISSPLQEAVDNRYKQQLSQKI